MAYIPDTFGAALGLTDKELIAAFEQNPAAMQGTIQRHMQMTGLTNADLLAFVKHYAPEAPLDLDSVMVYTRIPNPNQFGAMFRGGQHAPVTRRQLSSFASGLRGSGLLQAKKDLMQRLLHGGTADQPATPQPPAATAGRAGRAQKGELPMQAGVPAPPRVDYNPIGTMGGRPGKFDQPRRLMLGIEGKQQALSGMGQRPGRFDQPVRGGQIPTPITPPSGPTWEPNNPFANPDPYGR